MSRILKEFVMIPFLLVVLLFAETDTVYTSQLDQYPIYPQLLDQKPDLPSPLITEIDQEFVIAFNKFGKYALIPVTLSDQRDIAPQLYVDKLDFPLLARYGLHDEKLLYSLSHITGWDLDTITYLGMPGNLSEDGFLAEDEDIRSVLIHDNSIVTALGLTHPDLAKPLFHVLNMMEWDLKLGRWNMAIHKWDHIRYFYYNGHKIYVEAEDTKGGQMSIFNDGIQGAFHIKLSRRAQPEELALLAKQYHYLSSTEYEALKEALFTLTTGEMEPQYIMRYGFYEGHTYWRTDPIGIANVFGLIDLKQLESIFNNELYNVLTRHAVAKPQ